MKKLMILMVLLFTVISYAQIPHKTRDSLQIDKIRVDTEASKILNYADNKIVGFVSFDDFVVQLVADGRLAGGGGGTDILPLTNVFTGASNTFNNGIYVGTSLSPLITKGNADYSLNIGSNLFGISKLLLGSTIIYPYKLQIHGYLQIIFLWPVMVQVVVD